MSDFAKDINVPANDCISRQAAIDTIDDGAKYYREPHWIPVMERLPDGICKEEMKNERS